MSARQVDGYGPGELDSLHWDLLLGGIIALPAAGALLYLSRQHGAPASGWLVLTSIALLILAIAGCAVSSLYRRYTFLVWWRKGIIIASSLIFLIPLYVLTSLLSLVFKKRSGIGMGIGGPFGGPSMGMGTVILRPAAVGSAVVEADVGVDKDGRVYLWDAWHGRWRFRADSLDGFPAAKLRIKRTIFGPVDMPTEETTSSSVIDF